MRLSLEKERDDLIKKQNYNFEIMLKDWCTDNNLISIHQGITKIIEMDALIPPSTAEVERSFSLMNLISIPLHKGLSAENLGHCMRICKFPRSLTKNDYQQILSRWLEGTGTKSKNCQMDHRLQNKKRTFSPCIFILICIQHVRRKKTENIGLIFFYFMHINPVAIFSFFSRVLNFRSEGIS